MARVVPGDSAVVVLDLGQNSRELLLLVNLKVVVEVWSSHNDTLLRIWVESSLEVAVGVEGAGGSDLNFGHDLNLVPFPEEDGPVWVTS